MYSGSSTLIFFNDKHILVGTSPEGQDTKPSYNRKQFIKLYKFIITESIITSIMARWGIAEIQEVSVAHNHPIFSLLDDYFLFIIILENVSRIGMRLRLQEQLAINDKIDSDSL